MSTKDRGRDMMKVQGQCPACGKRSLFLGSGGWVTCSTAECSNPTLVSDLLDQHASPHHEVKVSDELGWSIVHPIAERIGKLLHCPLHQYLERSNVPLRPGRYQAIGDGPPWAWLILDDNEERES